MFPPLIAVLWQTLLAHALRVQVNRCQPPILALCVWLLYAADRLLDVQHPLAGHWEPARKLFARRHVRQIAAACACLAVVTIPLALHFLTSATLYGGLTLGFAVAIYFAAIHLLPTRFRALWPRELAVAVIFTLGSFLAVFMRAPSVPLILPTLLLTALCWFNCAAIETWEWQSSGVDSHGGPNRSTQWLAQNASAAGSITALFAAFAAAARTISFAFAAAAAVSAICFSLLAVFRLRLSVEAAVLAADLALCSPLLIFAYLWLR